MKHPPAVTTHQHLMYNQPAAVPSYNELHFNVVCGELYITTIYHEVVYILEYTNAPTMYCQRLTASVSSIAPLGFKLRLVRHGKLEIPVNSI